MSRGKLFIGVCGPGLASDEEIELAAEVGRLLAREGAVLVCGGLGGVMEAACRGAKEQGGVTVGILPSLDRATANPYVDFPIATGMSHARNLAIVASARAIIAISGEYGTLSEIALALKVGTPVVGLRSWALSKPGRPPVEMANAEDASQAVSLAIQLALEKPQP